MLEPNSFERKLSNQLFFEYTDNSKKVLMLPEVSANYVIKNIKKRHNGVVKKKKEKKRKKKRIKIEQF